MANMDKRIAQERKALMDMMDQGPHAIPLRKVDESIVIATWNIQQFGDRHSDRAIQYIADICERFDIVALQEVKTKLDGLGKLQAKLPGNYKILVTDPTGNAERFAFLYDKRTVIPTGLVCEMGLPLSAATHEGFQIHRMPYCVSFKAGRFDFVIVNVHVFFGSGRTIEFRQREIEAIAENVMKQSKDAKAFDRDFFVVGDFNIPDAASEFFQALVDRGFQMPQAMEQLGTNFDGSRTFDKIAWVPRPSFVFAGKCDALPFGEVLFQEKGPDGAREEISDHRPVWTEFTVKKLTQELDAALQA